MPSLPLGDDSLTVLMTGINRSKGVYVICGAYGGAIAKITSGATAAMDHLR